jgi:hypothetical protein
MASAKKHTHTDTHTHTHAHANYSTCVDVTKTGIKSIETYVLNVPILACLTNVLPRAVMLPENTIGPIDIWQVLMQSAIIQMVKQTNHFFAALSIQMSY